MKLKNVDNQDHSIQEKFYFLVYIMIEEAINDSGIAVGPIRDGRTNSDAYRTRAKVFPKIGRNDLCLAEADSAWDIDPRIPLWWRYFLKNLNPNEMRNIAPFLIPIIGIVLIFRLTLKSPKKDDRYGYDQLKFFNPQYYVIHI